MNYFIKKVEQSQIVTFASLGAKKDSKVNVREVNKIEKFKRHGQLTNFQHMRS